MCKEDISNFEQKESLEYYSYEDFMKNGYLSLRILDSDKRKYKRCLKRITRQNKAYRIRNKTLRTIIGLPIVLYTVIANVITTRNDKNMEYFILVYELRYKYVKHTQYDELGNGYGAITVVKKST